MSTPTHTGAPVGRTWRHHGRLAGRYALLTIALIVLVGPLLWQFLASVRGPEENVFGPDATLLPSDPSLHAYRDVFDALPILTYIGNSLLLCALAVTSQLVFATTAGYALSRSGWRGRRVAFLTVIAALIFPFESIMVSLFLMVDGMGLVDTIAGVWLPGFVGAVNILVMRAAFLAVPNELEDAAHLDGAGEWQRFRRIFLPSAKGALVVVGITTFIGAWDEFLWPLLLLRSDDTYTLTLGLAQLQSTATGYDERMVMAGSMVSVIPVLILFFATQRYFYRGVESGALRF